jgi:serine/threonine-protein kinase RsbT
MTAAYNQLLEVLTRHLSATNAEGTLTRSIREAGLRPDTITVADVQKLLPTLARRIRLYVEPVRHARVAQELAELGGGVVAQRSRTMVVKTEADISEVRRVAKTICEGSGARTFITHKIVTIVSELARNIVHYTPGGTIEVGVVRERHARCSILATDGGPGIQNLEEIMSGRYKSKTGMGRGLLGVKRLAERFNINPGPPGTRIEVEVDL